MAEATDKFYNLQVNLIKNGKIYAEPVAITNIWEKEDNIFLDIYFHRLNKSFVFDSVFIHDIADLSRDKYYTDIRRFVSDFYKETSPKASTPTAAVPKKREGVFDIIKNDIILLLFMAHICAERGNIKEKIICEYILKVVESAKNLSENYIITYISSFNPSVDDFYKALKKMKAKNPEQAQYLLKEIIKICLSDGYLHYAEKMYLADVIQTLRMDGLKLPKDII